MAEPARRYQVSPRPFPEVPPAIEWGSQDHGRICFRGRELRISKAFRGYPVALRPTPADGLWEVFFGSTRIAQLDLRAPASTP